MKQSDWFLDVVFFFSPQKLLFLPPSRRLKIPRSGKKAVSLGAFYRRERERKRNPTTFSACLFGGGFESEQPPPNANTWKYESLSDANCHLRAPAIRFRFSPSRIGGNFNSFRLDKKRFGCVAYLFFSSLPLSRTNTKFLPNDVRVNDLARAREYANEI